MSLHECFRPVVEGYDKGRNFVTVGSIWRRIELLIQTEMTELLTNISGLHSGFPYIWAFLNVLMEYGTESTLFWINDDIWVRSSTTGRTGSSTSCGRTCPCRMWPSPWPGARKLSVSASGNNFRIFVSPLSWCWSGFQILSQCGSLPLFPCKIMGAHWSVTFLAR